MPNFLKLPIYAFELSDRSYKYLRLGEVRGGTVVNDFGEGEIAAGVIEHGEIKKRDVLAPLLKELFLKKDIRFVAVSLPEEKGFLENVQLAGVKEEEIRQALELQLEEHIPLPPGDVLFDHELARKDKNHFDVVINAFPRTLVESYLDTFYSAGALPTFTESELAASARALIPQNFRGTAMVIDWGKTRTSFYIVEDGRLRFASTINIGGESLDAAIAKTLGVSQKEAENLKIKNGLLQNQDSLQVFQAIIPTVTALREEAEKYINFWQTHSENKKFPEKIFLSGGDANMKGLAEHFAEELGAETAVANPWVNVKFPKYYLPDITRQHAVRFSASIGLSLAAKEREETI